MKVCIHHATARYRSRFEQKKREKRSGNGYNRSVPNSYTLKQSKRGWNLLGRGSWTATSKLGGTVVQAPQESSGFAANVSRQPFYVLNLALLLTHIYVAGSGKTTLQ